MWEKKENIIFRHFAGHNSAISVQQLPKYLAPLWWHFQICVWWWPAPPGTPERGRERRREGRGGRGKGELCMREYSPHHPPLYSSFTPHKWPSINAVLHSLTPIFSRVWLSLQLVETLIWRLGNGGWSMTHEDNFFKPITFRLEHMSLSPLILWKDTRKCRLYKNSPFHSWNTVW